MVSSAKFLCFPFLLFVSLCPLSLIRHHSQKQVKVVGQQKARFSDTFPTLSFCLQEHGGWGLAAKLQWDERGGAMGIWNKVA